MAEKLCPYCREDIRDGAIICKHCKSALVDTSQIGKKFSTTHAKPAARVSIETGTLWLPVPALVCSLVAFLVLFDEGDWGEDEIVGFLFISVMGLVLSIVSVNVQQLGKPMAIAAIVLSCINLLAGLGLITEM
jgi:hypothetical protein